MAGETDGFRKGLLAAQEMKPELRAAYEAEVESLMNPRLTWRSGAVGAGLLVVLVACMGGLVWALARYRPGPLLGTGWAALLVGFGWAAALIARDLYRRKHSRKAVGSIAQALTGAAGTLTVVAMLMGLRHPADPASTFGVLYVFVFYFACAVWALQERIAAAGLARREEALRIELRVVELAERVGGGRMTE